MRIGIDINGVINNMDEIKLEYVSKFVSCKGRKLKNPNAYTMEQMASLSEEEIKEFRDAYQKQFLNIVKSRPFAGETIRQLKLEGHRIILMTRYYNDKKDPTPVRNWLYRNGIVYDQLVFTDRKELACEDWRIQLLIDDSPIVLNKVSGGLRCFCYETRYNRRFKRANVISVSTWSEIYYKMKNWPRTNASFKQKKRAELRAKAKAKANQ